MPAAVEISPLYGTSSAPSNRTDVTRALGDAPHSGDQPDSWMEDANAKLSGAVRFLLAQLQLELDQASHTARATLPLNPYSPPIK
jgi:hypothetical protein